MTAEAATVARSAYLAQIAAWLRDARIVAGLTQAELARRMRVSDSTISQWELGQAEMGVVQYATLVAFFQASAAGKRKEGRR